MIVWFKVLIKAGDLCELYPVVLIVPLVPALQVLLDHLIGTTVQLVLLKNRPVRVETLFGCGYNIFFISIKY